MVIRIPAYSGSALAPGSYIARDAAKLQHSLQHLFTLRLKVRNPPKLPDRLSR